MTDSRLLREYFSASGLKYGAVAEKLGLSRQSLQRKIENKSEFRASEIQALVQILQIDQTERDRIFFA